MAMMSRDGELDVHPCYHHHHIPTEKTDSENVSSDGLPIPETDINRESNVDDSKPGNGGGRASQEEQ